MTPVPPTTLGQFKNWSVEAFEFAKQFVFEKIGRTQKTNDLELEKKVALVRETQSQFRLVMLMMMMIDDGDDGGGND